MRRDVTSLIGIGALLIIIGDTFYSTYKFNHSVGYAIILVTLGFNTVQCLSEKPKQNKGFYLFLRYSAYVLPLYYSSLFFSIIASHLVQNGFAVKIINAKAVLPLLLVSNWQGILERNSTQPQVVGSEIFGQLHFVALVLQALLACSILSFVCCKLGGRRSVIVIVSSIAGFVFLCVFFFTPKNIALGVGRFWQFIFGCLLAEFSRVDNGQKSDKFTSEMVGLKTKLTQGFLLFLLLCSFAPIVVPRVIAETMVVLITGALLYTSIDKPVTFINNQYTTFVGKLSSCAFLAHWPLLAIGRVLVQNGHIKATELSVPVAFLTVALSLMGFYFFTIPLYYGGKRHRVLPWCFIAILFSSCLALILCKDPLQKVFNAKKWVALAENDKFLNRNYTLEECSKVENSTVGYRQPYGYCQFEDGGGYGRILIVGDEQALGDSKPIKDYFYGKFDSLRVYTKPGFSVLNLLKHKRAMEELEQIIIEFDPHVLIVDQQFSTMHRAPIAKPAKIKADPVYKQFANSLHRIRSLGVEKIIILEGRPVPGGNLTAFQNTLETDSAPLEQHVWRRKDLIRDLMPVNARIRLLEHDDVIIMNPIELLQKNGMLPLYDPRTLFAYFDDNFSFTKHGVKAASKFFEELVKVCLEGLSSEVEDENYDGEDEGGLSKEESEAKQDQDMQISSENTTATTTDMENVDDIDNKDTVELMQATAASSTMVN